MKKNKRHSKPYVFKGLPKPAWLTDAPKRQGLKVNLPDGLYTYLHRVLHVNYPNESAGFGEIKDDSVTWLWYDKNAVASSGGVDSSQGMALIAAAQSGHEINLQWHTHPSFDTYWSATDDSDQGDVMRSLLASGGKGFFTFLVYNFRSFRLRRVHYDSGRVSLVEDGFCVSGNILLNKKPVANRAVSSTVWKGRKGSKKKGRGKLLASGDANPLKREADDYTSLFQITGIEPGDWEGLKQKIDNDFQPGMYDLILDSPDLWVYLEPDNATYSFVR